MVTGTVGRVPREVRRLAAASGLLGAASVAPYLAVMVTEGDNSAAKTAVWAAAMAVPTVLALLSTSLAPGIARWTLLAATALFLPLVILVSLGIGFLAAGVLSGAAAAKLHTASPSGSRTSPSSASVPR